MTADTPDFAWYLSQGDSSWQRAPEAIPRFLVRVNWFHPSGFPPLIRPFQWPIYLAFFFFFWCYLVNIPCCEPGAEVQWGFAVDFHAVGSSQHPKDTGMCTLGPRNTPRAWPEKLYRSPTASPCVSWWLQGVFHSSPFLLTCMWTRADQSVELEVLFYEHYVSLFFSSVLGRTSQHQERHFLRMIGNTLFIYLFSCFLVFKKQYI